MGVDQPASVLISGASTGIGEACALRLDSLGWRVYAGVRRAADGSALQSKASDRLKPVNLDVTNPEAITEVGQLLADELGECGLDGLVNNAGIALAGPLEFLPVGDLRQQLEVNVIGQLAVTQMALPLLRKARGRVIMMSSISGLVTSPFLGPYSASKFALEALSDALRVELRPWGLRVIVIEPAGILTPIWEKSLAKADERLARMPPTVHEYYGSAIELMRWRVQRSATIGLPVSEVSRAVVEALTDPHPRARYIVGRAARWLIPLLQLAPVGLRDWLFAKNLESTKRNFLCPRRKSS